VYGQTHDVVLVLVGSRKGLDALVCHALFELETKILNSTIGSTSQFNANTEGDKKKHFAPSLCLAERSRIRQQEWLAFVAVDDCNTREGHFFLGGIWS